MVPVYGGFTSDICNIVTFGIDPGGIHTANGQAKHQRDKYTDFFIIIFSNIG